MNSFKKSLLLGTFLFTFNSLAGFLVEPYLGYKFGAATQTLKNSGLSNGEYKYSETGYGLGGRVGYSFLGLMGGLTGEFGSTSTKDETLPAGLTKSTDKDEYDSKYFGLFVGYELPILLRVWGSYYVNASWEASKTVAPNGTDKGDKFEGSGYGLGVGFTGLPFVSLNLEYRSFSFDGFTDGITGAQVTYPSTTASEYEVSEVFFSVSLPLDL